jgi:hypothetical protein
MQSKILLLAEHAKLNTALADVASVQLPFADAFDALYAGVLLAAGPILARASSPSAPTLGQWVVLLCGVALLAYGWRERTRRAAGAARIKPRLSRSAPSEQKYR